MMLMNEIIHHYNKENIHVIMLNADHKNKKDNNKG